ncbi:nitrate/nitrite transporter [Fusobacterium sp.]|uniref:MFS transporter n=1 Tax=Fusobacterium sp. TaxID=68766 RepID=UPI0025C0A2FB|nr:MFS transporter [Fusobacterium sp.]
MEQFLERFGLGEKLKKNLLAILIVAVGGAIIYGLPYFRYDYYDAYLKAYNLTNVQMGVFGSIYGVFGMVSYLFGGYVADRVSVKKILVLSLVGTGVGGFVHLIPNISFTTLVLLYAFWGFSSLFAFWPACVKAVRMLSDAEGQGKAFGIFEGGRGVAAALGASVAVVVYRMGVKGLVTDEILGMKYVIIFYSVINVLCGLLVQFNMKDEIMKSDEKISFTDIGKVVKLPAVWIISIVTFCNYVFTLSLYYFVPYGTSLLGMTVTSAAILAAVKRYVSPLSNVGGGFLGDKMGTSNLLSISFIVMALGTAGILFLPFSGSTLVIWLFVILYVVNYLFYNVNYSLVWAMMEEGAIPDKYSGTAAGLISTIGYLPEIFISLMAGKILDKFPGALGYRYFFGYLIVMLLLGAVFVEIWKRYLKKNNLVKTK